MLGILRPLLRWGLHFNFAIVQRIRGLRLQIRSWRDAFLFHVFGYGDLHSSALVANHSGQQFGSLSLQAMHENIFIRCASCSFFEGARWTQSTPCCKFAHYVSFLLVYVHHTPSPSQQVSGGSVHPETRCKIKGWRDNLDSIFTLNCVTFTLHRKYRRIFIRTSRFKLQEKGEGKRSGSTLCGSNTPLLNKRIDEVFLFTFRFNENHWAEVSVGIFAIIIQNGNFL